MKSELPKKEATTPKKRLGNAGKGRPKGSANKTPAAIKDMILHALEGVGGVDYLMEKANDPRTAGAFLGLVAKVMPTQVTGLDGGKISASLEVVFRKPNEN